MSQFSEARAVYDAVVSIVGPVDFVEFQREGHGVLRATETDVTTLGRCRITTPEALTDVASYGTTPTDQPE